MLSNASHSPAIFNARRVLGKHPAEALQMVEQVLNHDPHNSAAHRVVVEAASAMEMTHTAALSLEILVKDSPKDRDLAIQFANWLLGCLLIYASLFGLGKLIFKDWAAAAAFLAAAVVAAALISRNLSRIGLNQPQSR